MPTEIKIEDELKDMCQQCWRSPCICAKLDQTAKDLSSKYSNNKEKDADETVAEYLKRLRK